MDKQARRMVRDYLPEQHQQFFAQLSYLIVGTVDGAGNLWASILVGEPGFLSSPDEHTLRVRGLSSIGTKNRVKDSELSKPAVEAGFSVKWKIFS